MVRKIASFTAGAGLLLVSVAPVFAQNMCENFTTGPSSRNVCERLLKKKVKLEVSNHGSVNHTLNFVANSGNNTSDNNTVGGSVVTDDADVGTFFSTADLNGVDVGVDQTDPETDDQGSNSLTGPSSNNTVNMTTRKTVNVTVNNSGNITHNITATANSGNNTSDMNTMGGSVSTGKATVVGDVFSILNRVIVIITQ